MNRLKDLREDHDLSQREVAAVLNCYQTTYSRYETGNLSIPIDSLKKLAVYFHVSIDYLVGLTDERKAYPRSTK